jgi:hypothetical protein
MLGWFKRLRSGSVAPPTANPSRLAEGTSPAPAAPEPALPAVAPVTSAAPAAGAPAALLDIPHDKIAARAYEIWVRKGKPHGQDFKNWVEAEAELRAEFTRSTPEPLPRKSR